jgi:hypothetical protein
VAVGMGSSSGRWLSPLHRCLSPFHGSVSCAPSSNRACGFPAHGFRSSLGPRHARLLAWPLGAVLPGVSAPKGVLAARLGNHTALSSVANTEQPGPLRSASITSLHHYYEPLRLLPRPMTVFGFALCDPVAGPRYPRTPAGLPSCARNLSRRAVPITPPQPPDCPRLLLRPRVPAFTRNTRVRPAKRFVSRLIWVH